MTSTMPEVTTYTEMLPVPFTAPLMNPAPNGLYAATLWAEEGDGPTRWLDSGVEIRGANYSDGQASGVWDADWCTPPALDGPRKSGDRPGILDPFAPMTIWSYDECDLTQPSRAEVRSRAAQTLRLEEQTAAEREFSARLLADAAALPGGIASAADLVLAVGQLEAAFGLTNTVGFIHAGTQWLAPLTEARLVSRTGTSWTSPAGHRWVFGGGYVDGLEDTLVATSPTFGWRNSVQVREAIDERHNLFLAIAERSLVIGYEAAVDAVAITPEATP
ncbi:hypothetical protein A5773_20065 [Mycobacterium sp. 852014-52450_SCH5900713]|uniref:hypothetical protein n=1 Tax=Mycobacterium sp. 852014-52450_SCH5900713 TaxID=1834116 RepID=UPI000801FC63|nr:hypothetical protein [Mycobacterium sp. 852014-52450_SCH5900713]OBF93045.1 hypothetical protein A5773_20065 [Mycobacterium sp. 852014-52450_SCH5900713]